MNIEHAEISSWYLHAKLKKFLRVKVVIGNYCPKLGTNGKMQEICIFLIFIRSSEGAPH